MGARSDYKWEVDEHKQWSEKGWEVAAFVYTCWTKTKTMKGSNKRKSFVESVGWMVPILNMRRFSCLLRLSLPPAFLFLILAFDHFFFWFSPIFSSSRYITSGHISWEKSRVHVACVQTLVSGFPTHNSDLHRKQASTRRLGVTRITFTRIT